MSRDWQKHARERFALLEGKFCDPFAPEIAKDSGDQTDFGKSKDVAVATVVTTADLVKLLPIPDDSTFLRATKESLLVCEAQATSLLHFVQHELTSELQSAGVAFAPSSLDTLNRLSAIQNRTLRSAFKPRQQLTFRSAGQRVGRPDEAQEKRYWEYHTPNSFELYSAATGKNAKVLETTLRDVSDRHEMFEQIGKISAHSDAV